MLRLDYTPQDCLEFQQAIKQVACRRHAPVRKAAPAIGRGEPAPWTWIWTSTRSSCRLAGLWRYRQPGDQSRSCFSPRAPELGEQFHAMRLEGLLDLDNRKGKAPGAYCTAYPMARRLSFS